MNPPLLQAPARLAPVPVRTDLRTSAPTSWATRLACLSLICAWTAAAVYVETAAIGWSWDKRPLLIEQKTSLYYAAHLFGLLAALASGLLSALQGRIAKLPLSALFALFALFGAAGLWSLLVYSQEDFLSPKIFGATGPFVWFSSLILLSGMDRHAWHAIDRTVRFLSFLTLLAAIHAVLAESGFQHYVGLSRPLHYAIMLAWCGGWTLLSAAPGRTFAGWLRLLPAALLLPLALYAQSRSWLIMALLLGMIFLLGVPARNALRGLLPKLIAAGAVLVVAGLLLYGAAVKVFPAAAERFEARLYEDSRSQQYVEFFSDVSWPDLVWGRGPEGHWYWRGMGEYQFIDNQYLWMAFIGGLPVLLGYCTLILLPAVRTLSAAPPRAVAAAAWLLILWALAFAGLGTFVSASLSLPGYFMSLCAGRCWGWLHEEKQRVHREGVLAFHHTR